MKFFCYTCILSLSSLSKFLGSITGFNLAFKTLLLSCLFSFSCLLFSVIGFTQTWFVVMQVEVDFLMSLFERTITSEIDAFKRYCSNEARWLNGLSFPFFFVFIIWINKLLLLFLGIIIIFYLGWLACWYHLS